MKCGTKAHVMLLGAAVMLSVTCGGQASKEVQELAFEGQVEILPGFSFDSGLQPPNAPVQAALAISATGTVAVTAAAAASGSPDEPTLSGLLGRGAVAVEGGFAIEGELVVDITGVPSYEGPIPGLENVLIEFGSETAYDPFALEQNVIARADIPPTRLPAVPLPGGLPGSLVLELVEGSYVEVTLSGRSACIDVDAGRYLVGIDRTGTLVILPSVEIDVPLVGTQSFEIPEVSVDLAIGSSELPMTAAVAAFGARPTEGDHVEGSCSGGGDTDGNADTGGRGDAGSRDSDGTSMTTAEPTSTTTSPGDTGAETGGDPCSTNADCPGGSCVEGTCSSGGFCGTASTYGDAEIDACATSYCCEHFDVCTYDGADFEGCAACVEAGGGARCDGFLGCMDENCFEPWFPVCDSGVGFPDEEYAACVSNACCAAFNACTMNGTDLAACIDCFDAGSGPLCDEAVLCAHECVAPCDHDECTVGGPLEESCSVCAVAVCKTDPLCCTVAWDAVCVDAVATNLACSGSGGITCP